MLTKTITTGIITFAAYKGGKGFYKAYQRTQACIDIKTDGNYNAKSLKLVRYGNCNLAELQVKSGLMEKIADFEVQNEDIFVASFPKSGTTWLQEIVYLLFHPQETEEDQKEFQQQKKMDESDLMENKFPYLEYPYPGLPVIEKRKGQRRLIKTHLSRNLLPVGIWQSQGSKIIYIHRDPRDVIVSYYYFARMFSQLNYQGSLKDFAWQMMLNKVPYGPYFDHLDGYLSHAKTHPDKVLVINYEEMKKDPKKQIEKVAKFLKVEANPELCERIAQKTTFEAMKANPNTNYSHWDLWGLRNANESEFMRKGQVGDFKNNFDEELTSLVEEWIAASLQGRPHLAQHVS